MASMAAIRPLEERDIPEVVRLFGRVYPQKRWASQLECEAYFRDIFLGNPWVDPALPSWVAVEGDRVNAARIVGFIGVMPRLMRNKGRPIRAAVVSQLMVDPEKPRALAAAQLLRKALAGPQELTISDGANESSRKMWEALGGATSTLYSLQWRRPLRPAQCALQLASSRRGRAAARLAAPIAALADAYAAQRMSLHCPPAFLEEPLDAVSLLAALERAASRVALSPQYDLRSLEWLLAQAHAKRRHGELQARLLRESGGRIAGWFLYYLNSGTSRVLQLEAQEGSAHAVLGQLFHHAWRHGAAAIEGRMEPRFARTLSERHCFFLADGTYALAHAHDPRVLAALERGDALFSRLEGEWWMRFAGGPESADAAGSALSEFVSRLRFSWMRNRPQPALP
jgi:hypothetical protein